MAHDLAQCLARPTVRCLSRQRCVKALTIGVAITLVAALLSLAACGLFPSSPPVVTQGHGLPSLRHLDWGFAAINHPVWSPDGRWVAVLAGDDYAGAHVEVVSPDGQTKYDLSSWQCGEGVYADFAWLPDSRLSCINGDTPYPRLCVGAAPFRTCAAQRLSEPLGGAQLGLAWTPDGRSVLFPAMPNNVAQNDPDLYVIAPDGSVRQVLPFADHYGVATPSFRPHAAGPDAQLAYFRGNYVDMGVVHFDLVISAASEDAGGKLTLGPARTIASEQSPDSSVYAWSPSGRWLAVRYGDTRNGDKIAVINPDNPTQTLDVVKADLVDNSMFDPIWSPDGKTLIVFGGFGPQPYAIDIASYLASKGLQP
jgi:WD40-like Beta Propeller Repeat